MLYLKNQDLNPDVCIIGGGTAGVAGALFLTNNGLNVVVCEKYKIGSQASGVNYGGVRQQGRNKNELPLSRRSKQIWEELEKHVGSKCGYEQTGHLKIARNEREMEELETFEKIAKENFLNVELMTRKVIFKKYPFLGESVYGGSYCPSDGSANPRLVAPSFGKKAIIEGATILENEPVIEAMHTPTGFITETKLGRKIKSKYLVNCSGAWGDKVAAWFNEEVKLMVMNPNMLVTAPFNTKLQILNIGVVGGNVYIRQTDNGNIVYGGGFGVCSPKKIFSNPSIISGCHSTKNMVELIPSMINTKIIRSWTGIEGLTLDGLPIIEKSRKITNLVHAFGFSGHGFQLGPVIGEIISDLIIKGESNLPLNPFRSDRFKENNNFLN